MDRRQFIFASVALAGCHMIDSQGQPSRVITGSAPAYTGYGSNGSFLDSGERGLAISNCRQWRARDLEISRMQGVCVDFQGPSQWQDVGLLDGCYLHDSWKGLWTRNNGEGLTASNNYISNCVFGAHINSGNNTILGGQIVYCSIGVKIGDEAIGANDSHGIVSGVIVRHCTYLAVCQNVALGHLFDSCQFVGGQAGSDQGAIQIVDSIGISFVGCGFANVDITVTGPMPSFKNNTVRGTVTLNGVVFSGNN